MQITRWTDETGTTIQEVEGKLLSVHNDEQSDTSTGYINWVIEKQFSQNKKGTFNGKNVEYNLFTFSVDQIPVGVELDDESVTKKQDFLLYMLFQIR